MKQRLIKIQTNEYSVKKKENEEKKRKKPWPTKDAMTQVYKMRLWGDNRSDFYSGMGSHLPEFVEPYLEKVKSFLTSFENPLSVCDLGCGDFNVGKELVEHSRKYIAVDIVEELIERNRKMFNNENLEFHCLNIASDELPSGDCALLRQVLQHLSNREVKRVVSKLAAYKYVILTEHLPEGDFTANKEIISGQGIRLKKQSGVDLLAPPFNLKIKEEKHLLTVPARQGKGMIVTTLYRIF